MWNNELTFYAKIDTINVYLKLKGNNEIHSLWEDFQSNLVLSQGEMTDSL
jgi:hypothetical protein